MYRRPEHGANNVSPRPRLFSRTLSRLLFRIGQKSLVSETGRSIKAMKLPLLPSADGVEIAISRRFRTARFDPTVVTDRDGQGSALEV
jgi:hypothetical protein